MGRTRRVAVTSMVAALVALTGAGPRLAAAGESQDPLILESLNLSRQEALSYTAPNLVTESLVGHSGPLKVCGTPPPDRVSKERFDSSIAGWQSFGGANRFNGPLTIPVVFWVIQNGAGKGLVTNEQIYSQIDVLNWAYRKAGISFYAADGWLVTNNKYYKKCGITKRSGRFNGVYKKMTKRLTRQVGVDPATTLNIYSCNPRGGLLGEAFGAVYLEIYPNYDESHHMNGVVVHNQTLPGGNQYPYNAGATAAHEIGHYFGLLHTFFPDEIPGMTGCDFPGDGIDDTPYEESPAYEAVPETNCAKGRDTCPSLPKKDPVSNFMDYSSDYCQEKFSKQQRNFMRDVIDYYRPSLIQ